MNEISEYLLECDINFYKNYALPTIKNDKKLFDLEGFESVLEENKNISVNQTIEDLFCQFEIDKSSQYELNPKFGRYVIVVNKKKRKENNPNSIYRYGIWLINGIKNGQLCFLLKICPTGS